MTKIQILELQELKPMGMACCTIHLLLVSLMPLTCAEMNAMHARQQHTIISVSISAIEAFICSTSAALAARAASRLLLFSSLCFCASCAATSRAAASMAAALSDTADSPPGVLGSDPCCTDAPEQRCKEGSSYKLQQANKSGLAQSIAFLHDHDVWW